MLNVFLFGSPLFLASVNSVPSVMRSLRFIPYTGGLEAPLQERRGNFFSVLSVPPW